MKLWQKKYRSYCFGACTPLDTASLDTLIHAFTHGSPEKPGLLQGRMLARFATIPEAGRVVIKSYQRGGIISLFTRDIFLRTGNIRSRKEFEGLALAARAGVRVPRPVAFASQGGFFYKAWLITAEIHGHRSFAELCMTEEKKAAALIPEISQDVQLLINSGIFHVDLHPGNILVDHHGTPCIIDFDKALYQPEHKKKLAEKYQKRWTRAVDKYRLPASVTDLHLM